MYFLEILLLKRARLEQKHPAPRPVPDSDALRPGSLSHLPLVHRRGGRSEPSSPQRLALGLGSRCLRAHVGQGCEDRAHDLSRVLKEALWTLEARGVFQGVQPVTQDVHFVSCSEAGSLPGPQNCPSLCPCARGECLLPRRPGALREPADPSFLARGGGEQRAAPEQELGVQAGGAAPAAPAPACAPSSPAHGVGAPPRPRCPSWFHQNGGALSPLLPGAHSSYSPGAPVPQSGSPFLQNW